LRYIMERYVVAAPFPNEYDGAVIAQDEGNNWSGSINNYWQAGDERHYFLDGHSIETAGRFRNIYLPADAEIIEASLIFSNGYFSIESHVDSKFSIEDSIAAASFPTSGIYANFVARSRLATMVDWNDIMSISAPMKSPDIGSLLQGLVDKYGEIDYGSIVIFWGDRDGNTPVPSAGNANLIVVWGIPSVKLRVEFESAQVIPQQHRSIYYFFEDSAIADVTYEVSDEKIVNDIRIIVPHATHVLDFTFEPPIWRPVDYTAIFTDDISQEKYGRRTFVNKEAAGNWGAYGPSYCARILKGGSEPVPEMSLRVKADDDATISKLLATRITDKAFVMIDEAGLEEKFWIDNKVLRFEHDYIVADFGLNKITTLENIPGLFEVDVDRVDDVEEVIA
jgi:hypothetical protein